MTPKKNDGLDVADGLVLPAESVTETFAMLARRGGGKSNAAVVMAEQMWDHGHQWVAIDPKGDWWGIRSSADGQGPGLPVLVLGGQHGDLPLDPSAGALLAHLVVERNLTAVLDVSSFTKGEQIKFAVAFAEELFKAIRLDPRPLHLFLEEAEEFLPQQVRGETARMVGAYSKIAKQGRTSGLGVTLITQRSASLNKDALSQTGTLILFRTTSPHDRKAVVAWAEYETEAKDIAASLSSLEPGESWVLSPGFLGTIEKVRWHRRRTFDSGATPITGAKRRAEPVSLADIDLGEIRELMAETVDKAEKNDPKVLRRRIVTLEAELAKRPSPVDQVTEPVVEIREVEVPVEVIPPEVLEVMGEVITLIEDVGSVLSRSHERLVAGHGRLTSVLVDAERRAVLPPVEAHVQPVRDVRTVAVRPNPPVRTPPAVRPSTDNDIRLDKRGRALLTVLAQYPEGRTNRQLALLTGYSPKSSTIGAGLSILRKAGYVSASGSPVTITPEGVAALGDFETLPQGPELLAYWLTQLGARERAFLTMLVDSYPHPMGRVELAEANGYSPDSSTVGAGMSRLRGLGLVDGWAASADFITAIQ